MRRGPNKQLPCITRLQYVFNRIGNKNHNKNFQVRRTSIRRIIVDPVVQDCNGSDRIRVHFELNCPVLIRRAYRTAKQESVSTPKP